MSQCHPARTATVERHNTLCMVRQHAAQCRKVGRVKTETRKKSSKCFSAAGIAAASRIGAWRVGRAPTVITPLFLATCPSPAEKEYRVIQYCTVYNSYSCNVQVQHAPWVSKARTNPYKQAENGGPTRPTAVSRKVQKSEEDTMEDTDKPTRQYGTADTVSSFIRHSQCTHWTKVPPSSVASVTTSGCW